MKTPVLQYRARRSHVAGSWGFAWLHATKWGGLVVKGKEGLRTINGFVVRLPRCYLIVTFRRRELKL
jgi:hypothetical protein